MQDISWYDLRVISVPFFLTCKSEELLKNVLGLPHPNGEESLPEYTKISSPIDTEYVSGLGLAVSLPQDILIKQGEAAFRDTSAALQVKHTQMRLHPTQKPS